MKGRGSVPQRLGSVASLWLSPGGLLAMGLVLGLLGGVIGHYGLKAFSVLCFVGGAFWLLGRGISEASDDPPQ